MSGGFYRAFEDRYRGSRDIISERLAVYLPFVQPLAGDGAAALDLGCGRGEWLELLVKAGFTAEGVDLDEGMLAACRERGLQVVNGDALAALRARPDDSLAVVSAFHLVEHISFEQVQVLIAEALRALQPGGLLILETPNPENLVVGTSSFYDDPSHLKPVPSKLLAFAVEFSGFGRHKVLRLQEPEHLRDGAGIALFDVLAGVSPDYGIVAQKAGGPAHLAVLDTLFEAHYGLDLHELAQRYEQQQDAVHSELGQLREAHELRGRALQGQLASVDAQIAHVHATTVAFAADLAGAELARSALAERLCQLCEAHELSGRAVQGQLASVDAQIAHVHATTVAFAADLAGAELARSALAARLDKIESLGLHPDHAASLSKRLEQVENLTAQLDQVESLAVRLDGIEARSRQLDTGGGEQPSLRLRLSDLQKQHQEAVDESARLAAHVAWIEGRLTHAEAQAAALRHQERIRPETGAIAKGLELMLCDTNRSQ